MTARALLAALLVFAASSVQAWPIIPGVYGGTPGSPAFPLSIWVDLSPITTPIPDFASLSAAVAATNFTIIYGISGTPGGSSSWPEHFGADNGEMLQIQQNNLFLIQGVHLPYSAATETIPITSGTYNSSTGLVTLTLSAAPPYAYAPSWTFDIGGAAGSGTNLSAIDGPFTATTGTTGTTITYTIATGLNITSITGGNFLVAGSVASAAAMAASIGAQANLIGYAPGDEENVASPNCPATTAKPISFAMVPTVVSYFASEDPTRPTYYNTTNWMWADPTFPSGCQPAATNAVQAVAAASFDDFPVAHVKHNQHAILSNFLNTTNDTLWLEEINVQALLSNAATNQPAWSYVEGGGDNLVSGNFNSFPGGLTGGSTTLVNAYFGAQSWNSGAIYNQFTTAWQGLTVVDTLGYIPPGTTIMSVTDANHLVLSAAPTVTTCVPGEISVVFNGTASISLANQVAGCPDFTAGYAFRPIVDGSGSPGCIPAGTTIQGSPTSTTATLSQAATCSGTFNAIASAQTEMIFIIGGAPQYQNSPYPTNDCVVAINLCVVQGNAWRAAPAQVNGEVWMSLIAGASGIEYFVADASSFMFGLGAGTDPVGTPANLTHTAAQQNIKYVNGMVLNYAGALKGATLGACSLRAMTLPNTASPMIAVNPTCTGGSLTLASSQPALAMVKSFGGQKYLFAMSSVRGSNTALTFTVSGITSAALISDSNSQYDPTHATAPGTTFSVTSAMFSDTFGANGDDYQVKVYRVN